MVIEARKSEYIQQDWTDNNRCTRGTDTGWPYLHGEQEICNMIINEYETKVVKHLKTNAIFLSTTWN